MSKHDSYAALRYADFRFFSFARTITSMGAQMQNVAIGWQIYEHTRSPLALGNIGLVEAVPSLGLALWAGHIADRRDRRGILIIALLLRLFCTLGLIGVTLGGIPAIWPIYALLFLDGVAIGFQGPSAAALMPQLIPQAVFPNAIAWRTTMFQVSNMIGPILAGYLLHTLKSPAYVYGSTVALGLISLLFYSRIKPYPAEPIKEDEPVMQSIMNGIRFVRGKQVVLGAMTLDLFAVLFGGVVALLPIFAKDILHVGPQGLGILTAATSAGAMVAAITQVHRPPVRRAGMTLLTAVAVFGLCMIGFALSRNLYLSVLFLALSGVADNMSMVIRSTLIQGSTPNAMRGRVSSVNGVFVGASNELGRFESGLAAQLMGTVPSVIFGGTMTLGVVAMAAWRWPKLRQIGRLDEIKPEE